MFTNKDLKNLIIPLFVEQFLLMFVGIADTFVVSFSSEADVSGVSLVTSFNTVLIFLFTALSSGGAVIISQYIGSRDEKAASRSSGQLLMISTVISVAMMALILVFHTQLLRLLFGKIEADVMAACESYLWITTLSLPFLAIYDSGAALCRSIGKTNVTMNISVIANIINVIGNCLGVFVLHMGAVGVAYPSLISRLISAAAVTAYGFQKQNSVRYRLSDIFVWDGRLLRKVMGIAMAPVYTTVIGQCMGARDIDAANLYFKKLNKITLVLSVLWNALVFMVTPLIVRYSAISQDAKNLVIWLVLINNIFNGFAYPFAGSLGNGLRAAGDVKFTMVVSITLTIAARLLFSALFGLWLGWGVIGVAIGMSMDLVFRGLIFIWRLKSQRWTRFQLI